MDFQGLRAGEWGEMPPQEEAELRAEEKEGRLRIFRDTWMLCGIARTSEIRRTSEIQDAVAAAPCLHQCVQKHLAGNQ